MRCLAGVTDVKLYVISPEKREIIFEKDGSWRRNGCGHENINLVVNAIISYANIMHLRKKVLGQNSYNVLIW